MSRLSIVASAAFAFCLVSGAGEAGAEDLYRLRFEASGPVTLGEPLDVAVILDNSSWPPPPPGR